MLSSVVKEAITEDEDVLTSSSSSSAVVPVTVRTSLVGSTMTRVVGLGSSSSSSSSSSETYSYEYSSSDIDSQSISVKLMVWGEMEGRAASERGGEEAIAGRLFLVTNGCCGWFSRFIRQSSTTTLLEGS
jgi:hypothetical protein